MVNNTNSICKYTFYNPLPLKVSQIVNYYTSTTYSAANFIIEGSNDNQNWTEIGTYTVTKTLTQTIPVNSTRFYKCRFPDLFSRTGECFLVPISERPL